jgi:hypothetical protein
LVLIHAIDKFAFKSLVENVLEVLQRIDHGGLLDVRIGNRFFPNLVEKQLVCRLEFGSDR